MQGYNYNQYNGYNSQYNGYYNQRNYYNSQGLYNNQMYNYQQPKSQIQKDMNETHKLTLAESFASFWKNCFSFHGLAQRNEYWIPSIVYIIITNTIWWLLSITILVSIHSTILTILVTLIFKGVILVPLLALMTRRLHDFGVSGMWILILWLFHLIPFIGRWLLFLGVILVGILPSDPKSPYRGLKNALTL